MFTDSFLTKHITNWVQKEIETSKDLLVKEKSYNSILEIQARINAYYSVLYIIDKIVNNIQTDLEEAQKMLSPDSAIENFE